MAAILGRNEPEESRWSVRTQAQHESGYSANVYIADFAEWDKLSVPTTAIAKWMLEHGATEFKIWVNK